jgi:predicted dinucleotide-binding enzyme
MNTSVRTIGFIGSGNIGGTVAKLAIAAGYHVVLSNSRGPETLAALCAELGKNACAKTPQEAAQAGDMVVLTVPLRAILDLPPALLSGKVVLDTGNYYPDRDGRIPELDNKTQTTSGLVQKHFPSARIVKAFNNIYFKHLAVLARSHGSPERSALPIAGDDASAKALATTFLDAIGYDAVDVGPLCESWRSERDMPAYGSIYGTPNSGPFYTAPASPASAEKLRAALAAGVR